MRQYVTPVLLFIAAFACTSVLIARIDRDLKRLDVIEACEQLNSFMHDGKRYYCAPWIEMAPKAEQPQAREESTHA